ncbi:efflux RND transporter periplasmic adaptor subunit [Pseudodesulfovibrio thermohalotolerans]|uniref:efflux RND transporter periplasmic adaptor subunit n=1 Tax=Pseudodesulfovibrio thermohalotolerans TaxID=2880651 RepID=UPI0022B9F3CB|nr:efflux RND transporter periplasmic adaptor subunit [Pseudodesulfovibrio thermohalotolerans]WFS63305.1 efflux RND transporter periplasmic adaptor subunit [Pseudodesulfovibrio thermohalotolerans]
MNRFLFPVALACLAFLAACDRSPEPVPVQIRPVKTAKAMRADSSKLWSFAGTAEDALATKLSFRVGGKIIDFPGNQIGRRFAEGAVIARLDPSDYELELRQAEANMEQVRANFVRAKADMRRNSRLFESRVISRGELDQVEADFKSYEARLSASAKQLDIARKQLSYTTLHAPFDGWIGEVEADLHQNVAAGQSIATYNAGRQMKMYISVPDTLIARVKEGDQVSVVFDALPGKVLKGAVHEIGVESGSGSTYPVKVYLKNDSGQIRSGMSGHVNFTNLGRAGEAFYLPPVAVVGEPDGAHAVWVVNPDTSSVTRRDVTVGQLTPAGLEILDGLNEGDVVVIRGVHSLEDGRKVRLIGNGAEG